MFKLIKYFLFFILVCAGAFGQTTNVRSANLIWKESCNPTVIKYTVYYTTNVVSKPVTNITAIEIDDCDYLKPAATNIFYGKYNSTNRIFITGITNVTCTVTNLVIGTKYYFTLTCSSSVSESGQSPELSFVPVMTPILSTVRDVVVLSWK